MSEIKISGEEDFASQRCFMCGGLVQRTAKFEF